MINLQNLRLYIQCRLGYVYAMIYACRFEIVINEMSLYV